MNFRNNDFIQYLRNSTFLSAVVTIRNCIERKAFLRDSNNPALLNSINAVNKSDLSPGCHSKETCENVNCEKPFRYFFARLELFSTPTHFTGKMIVILTLTIMCACFKVIIGRSRQIMINHFRD